MTLEQSATNFHIAIQVTCGGYIVHAMAKDMEAEGEWDFVPSVFTDIETMLSYVRRITLALEGPCFESPKKIGGLGVP